MKEYLKNYLNIDHQFDRITMGAIFSLVIVIAGIFGFLYEVVFYFFNSGMKDVFWRGGNFLPWINIYAIGAILIYFLTYKKRKNPFYVFFVSVIATGILEYIGGWGMEHIFQVKCWDYNTEILSWGSIDGYVCVRSVFIFGLCALLLIYLIIPFCFFLAKRMDRKKFLIFSYSICAIFLFDEFYNLLFARILDLPRASEIYKRIGFHYQYF